MKTETARIIAELQAVQRSTVKTLEQIEATLELLGVKTVYRFPKMEVK